MGEKLDETTEQRFDDKKKKKKIIPFDDVSAVIYCIQL